MAEQQEPFADVRPTADGFSLPELKWRELLFVGALKEEGGVYVRDATRPLPPFRNPDLFPEGSAHVVAGSEGGRILLRRVPWPALDSRPRRDDERWRV